MGVTGEMLVDLNEDDFDVKDFPNAKRFHLRLFWKKLKQASATGVNSPRVIGERVQAPNFEQKQNFEQRTIKRWGSETG